MNVVVDPRKSAEKLHGVSSKLAAYVNADGQPKVEHTPGKSSIELGHLFVRRHPLRGTRLGAVLRRRFVSGPEKLC